MALMLRLGERQKAPQRLTVAGDCDAGRGPGMLTVASSALRVRGRLALGAHRPRSGTGFGEPRFTIRAEFEQDAPAALGWLYGEAQCWTRPTRQPGCPWTLPADSGRHGAPRQLLRDAEAL
jgi:hypothetical protein